METNLLEKKYLRWYNKVGYGTGDIAGNVVYAFLTSFVMIYLTDTMGMQAGIVATLIMLSKFLDGASDFAFGFMLDRTHTKMGKARPWMFWAFFGCAAMIIAIFAIPTSLGDTAKYAWFFIAYTLLNAGFYTANNISYSALTALITKNTNERVQMGSFRFIFAFGTSMIIQAVTVNLVEQFGGGADGWRTVAIIYAIIGILSNSLSVFSVKELSPEELAAGEEVVKDDRLPLKESMKLLFTNKYFLLISTMFIVMQLYGAMLGMGIYYMTYVLGDAKLLGNFATAINMPQMVILIILPFIVARFKSMWKVDLFSYGIVILARFGIIAAGYMGNVTLMLVFTAISSMFMAPLQGTLTAMIAEASDYTFIKTGKRIDGLMYSSTSLGTKIGGGIAVALSGWLLDIAGYISTTGDQVVTQPASVISMLNVTYLWLPTIACIIIGVIVYFLDMEKQNRLLRGAKENPLL